MGQHQPDPEQRKNRETKLPLRPNKPQVSEKCRPEMSRLEPSSNDPCKVYQEQVDGISGDAEDAVASDVDCRDCCEYQAEDPE